MKQGFLALTFFLFASQAAFAAADVQEITSPGGIKAWLVEEHALPLIAVKIAFRDSGYAYDPKGLGGRATMTAALLMEGAGDMDSHAFNEALEDNAIRLNFATDEDLFKASVESLSEYKEKAFSYLSLPLTSPRFDDSAMERVRSQTLSLLVQQEEEPGYLVHRGWQQIAYGDHPYGNSVLGDRKSVPAIGKKELEEFTRRYLTRENIIISVVGDITPKELGELLDKNLGGLPVRYDPDVTVSEIQLPTQASQKIIEHDIPQTMVIFGENGIKRDNPNYFAGYVMNQILGGGGSLNTKLGIELRQKRGLTYSVYSMLDPMLRGAAWRGAFATRNAEAGNAVATLRATLKEFSQKGPTDKELDDAKKFITGSFVLGLDSNGEIANYLISMQLHHLGIDYLKRRNAMMEAVKKEDVMAMAKRLTNPDNLLVVMVGKPVFSTGKP